MVLVQKINTGPCVTYACRVWDHCIINCNMRDMKLKKSNLFC